MYYQNVRGLRTKTDTFYRGVLSSDFDIGLFTETWLCDGILDTELCDSKYDLFRRDRGSLGGGLMALCAPRLQARPRPEWERTGLESMWLTIPARKLGTSQRRDLHICIVYIPPDNMIPTRIEKFMALLKEVIDASPNDNFIICGDFNLPNIKWTTGKPEFLKKGTTDLQDSAKNLIQLTSFFNLKQFNSFVNSHNNTLDLIFSNFALDVGVSSTPVVKVDGLHPPIEIDACDITIPPLKVSCAKKYIFRKANYTSINMELGDVDWRSVLLNCNVEDMIKNFYSILDRLILEYVPQISSSSAQGYPEWYSRALIKIIKEKIKIHRQYKRHKNPIDYLSFSILRQRQKVIQDSCYKTFISNSETNIKKNPKLFWKYIKSKRNSSSNYPNIMNFDDRILEGEKDICSAFNEFFHKNFTQPSANYPYFDPNNVAHKLTLNSIEVSHSYILKLLQNLDDTKGPGSDGIPPLFYKRCAEAIATPLVLIFNRCLSEGYCPDIWKTAIIVPVPKKGLKTNITNYRPISILNTLSKLLERVVHDHLYPIVCRSVPSQQHGFIRGRSTNTNLAVFTNDVLRGMDGGNQVDAIYTDFEKAFDRVDHVILLRKLCELGVNGSLLRWTESYLRNRSQMVVIGGFKSDLVGVPSGVPQGSILGPLLYVAYLYDIDQCFKHARFLMYADDTKIYMTIKDIEDCLKLQDDLTRLDRYYRQNRIGVNSDKCTVITFTRKNKYLKFEYNLNNLKLKRDKVTKDLGIYLDSKLTFADHVSVSVNKAYKNLGFILRASKPFSDIHCVKLLYYAYVRSILEYCSVIWNPHYLVYREKIEFIQRKFIKHLNYRTFKNNDDYKDSCKYHRMVALENRRTVLDMSFLYDVCSGSIDSTDLTSLFLNLYAPSIRTRHTVSTLFSVPFTRTIYAKNSIVCRILRSYNKHFHSVDPFHLSKKLFKKGVLELTTCNA